MNPYLLASRETKNTPTIIKVGDCQIGRDFIVIAGPCSVESAEQLDQAARAVKQAGANFLRGGAFKPRTNPYAFQGLGIEALEFLAQAREKYQLPIVTELLNLEHLEITAHYADIIQIGSRNMQNFELLRAVGKLQKPILLKRGLSARLEEFLSAAEYILSSGNPNVILCERGIRTFETATRNTLDLNIIPLVKELSHLPIIVDPSHGTGKASLVKPLSLAAKAVGADGLIIEVHPNPSEALSDGDQSLDFPQFRNLMEMLKKDEMQGKESRPKEAYGLIR